MPDQELIKNSEVSIVATKTENYNIHLNFSELFDIDLDDYSLLNLSLKKNIYNKKDFQEYFEVINECENIHEKLLGLAVIANDYDSEYDTIEDLVEPIMEFFSPDIVQCISDYAVEQCRINEVDLSKGNSDIKNEELQFTNEHGYYILKWSFACNLLFPFIAHYSFMKGNDTTEFVSNTVVIFNNLTKVFPESNNINIIRKIKNIITNRINMTKYSDRIIWNFLNTTGTNPSTFAYDLVNKITTDIIPKIQQGTNVISFLHVVINHQINYLFRANFLFTYKPIRIDSISTESTSEIDNLEQMLIQQDEGMMILTEVNLANHIDNLIKRYNYVIEEDTINVLANYIIKAKGISRIQQNLIFLFLLNEVKSVKVIKTLNLRSICKIIIIINNWMCDKNYMYLPRFLLSRIDYSVEDKKNILRKKALSELFNSEYYGELIFKRYSFTHDIIINANIIPDMITNMFVKTYIDYETNTVLDFMNEAVSQELMQFCNDIIQIKK